MLGTAVLLDGITQRIEEELGRPATLVVTGGLAKCVIPLCRHPLTYEDVYKRQVQDTAKSTLTTGDAAEMQQADAAVTALTRCV